MEPGIRARVERFAIPGIADARYTGIFGDLHDVIELRQREERGRGNAGVERILERLRQEVSADAYADVQRRHLIPATEHQREAFRAASGNWSYYADPSSHLKYLDVCHWVASKFRRAVAHLRLDQSKGQKILDLGCGAGHAVWVYRQMGHDAIGMDRRGDEPVVQPMIALFDDMCRLLGVDRLEGRVRTFEPLPAVPSRFDLVTAFMGTFSRSPDDSLWSADEWRFFLDDIFDNVLNEDGVLYMNLTREAVSASGWDLLASRADLADAKTCSVRIRRASRAASSARGDAQTRPTDR